LKWNGDYRCLLLNCWMGDLFSCHSVAIQVPFIGCRCLLLNIEILLMILSYDSVAWRCVSFRFALQCRCGFVASFYIEQILTCSCGSLKWFRLWYDDLLMLDSYSFDQYCTIPSWSVSSFPECNDRSYSISFLPKNMSLLELEQNRYWQPTWCDCCL